MRNAWKLCHLSFAFFHDFLEFLWGELAGIRANEYAILKLYWHILLLSTSALPMVGLQPDGRSNILDFGWMCSIKMGQLSHITAKPAATLPAQ
jgi:hypothetical protein